MASIKITYTLNPPAGVTSTLQKNKSHEFKVDPSAPAGAGDSKAYYGALRKSLEAARTEVGDELTAWRDVVGKAELTKETKKGDEEDEGDEIEE